MLLKEREEKNYRGEVDSNKGETDCSEINFPTTITKKQLPFLCLP